ncbi:MAG TPA: HAD-IIIC family phosphatase [Chitinophagales bacterium]|nr:HAD-IIIC family phosphatase [Chitinophagales bacterium]
MRTFSELKKNLKKDFSLLEHKKVAILGDTSTQLLYQAIRATGYDKGYNLEVFEADFNQIDRQIFDPSSELYEFNPEFVIIFQSSHKLLYSYNKMNLNQSYSLADERIEKIKEFIHVLQVNLKAKIIYYNYPEIDDAIFGNYANNTTLSFLYQIRKLNFELMNLTTSQRNFYICDLSTIQNQLGKSVMFDTSVYINTEMVLSLDALPVIASRTIDLVAALSGKFKKCLILDLDNTTWGGIIGDDGIENIQIGSLGIGKAFSEFQYWAKKLKQRGVILAVCSKNTESIAKEPFEKHPDMVLRLDDIAVFVANWENKADNIRHIQQVLNIGFDSMVFLDDNPFERNLVREQIKDITVPELPEDPADYLEYLYTLNLFETISFSELDAERTKQYQVEAQRVDLQKKITNEDDFLKTLSMTSLVESFNKFNIPRVAQLSQRSNQFNLRTIRYTEADIELLAQSGKYYTFTFTLDDKFGENGLVCVIILEKLDEMNLFIDTWFMSCRVLKRGMEGFVLNTIVEFAQLNGFKNIIGEYIPTPKNEMVKDHFKHLGFQEIGGKWQLELSEYQYKNVYITKK